MRVTELRLILWIACVAGAVALQAQVSPWSSGVYSYDGAGNVKAIGSDYYVYDEAGRLVKGSADKQRSGGDSYQTYTYDPFGNRLTVQTTGTPCVNGCGVPTTVDAFNHLTNHGATYDGAGNIQQLDNFTYTYDGAGMLSKTSVPAAGYDVQYVYGADDERIAVYTGGGQWRFSVRDLDRKVIREVTASQSAGGTTWTWSRDHVFRDGLLLASVLPGTTRNYHLDHLGTPRLVTDENHHKIGIHAYYPFGDELSLGLQEPVAPDALKFTGHERDEGLYGLSLDYMHARYYSAILGRFISTDPVPGSRHAGQSWNRYAYVLNNPARYSDPNGLWEWPAWIQRIFGHSCSGTCPRFYGSVTVQSTPLPLSKLDLTVISLIHNSSPSVMARQLARGDRMGAGFSNIQMAMLPFAFLAGGEEGAVEPEETAESVEGEGAAAVVEIPEDVQATLDRIDAGETFPHRNDGAVFRNREGKLPSQPEGYYHEYVHPTPGVTHAGVRRIVTGAAGEIYYTLDHYGSFIQLK